jgi:hypothetical protein
MRLIVHKAQKKAIEKTMALCSAAPASARKKRTAETGGQACISTALSVFHCHIGE